MASAEKNGSTTARAGAGLGYDDGRACIDRGPSRLRASHVGKGPRGFRRSDQRILLSLCETLEDHPEIDASGISVSCQSGEVTLDGTVPDAAMHARAESCARAIPGVLGVIDRLREQTARPRQDPGPREEPLDPVDEASAESMIASDPPGSGLARIGGPRRTYGTA
jgi:hypothetical protein